MNRIFSKSKPKLPKVVHIDARTFRETDNSVNRQGVKAKYIFVKPGKNHCEITAYYRSLNILEKLKHRKDAKTTTRYLKNAAERYAGGPMNESRRAAETILNKKNKNLAKLTPQNEAALATLALTEFNAEQARNAPLKPAPTAPVQAVETARTAKVPPLKLEHLREFQEKVQETSRLMDDLESILGD